jgi:glycosyltransferase involved in cell wall biosynthesis
MTTLSPRSSQPSQREHKQVRAVHVIKAKGIAGAERHLLDLLPGLRTHGVEPHVLLIAEPNHTADTMEAAIRQIDVPVERLVIYRHFEPGLFRVLHDAFLRLQPQIVHTHLMHADVHGIPAAKWASVPAILSTRHDDDPVRKRQPLRTVYGGLWRLTDTGIAISEAIKRFCIEVEHAPPRKVHVIYHGMAAPELEISHETARRNLFSELGLPPETTFVGMVCRLMDAKGIPDALDAFAQVKDDFPTVHFVIAGDGPLRSQIEAQIAELGLTPRVHLLGWREAPLEVIAALDILLMPSTREGFGMTLLEAMSQSVPIIGSTASALPEVILNEETGLTVPPNAPETLAHAMRRLLSDAALRQRFGQKGRARLEQQFNLTQMIDETFSLYQRVYRS